MEWTGKRYWLVGASEGLGAALAQQLSRAGVHVILSARTEDRLHEVARGLSGPSDVVPMDVTDPESVARAVETVGAVDGVVWLASVYWPMTAQDWDVEKSVAMADVNFTGALRVLGHVVPAMVARDAGHVVVIGSLAGYRGLPGAIGYGATKAGCMSLAESLQTDLRHTGLRIQVANPGFIRTRQTDKNTFRMPFLMEPEDAAREVFELMCDEGAARKSFPRLFSIPFRLSRMMPDWRYYRIFT